MRRLQLLTMMAALLWSASAFGQEVAEEPETLARTFGVNVSCGASGAPYPEVAGCSIRRRMLTLGDFEFALGFDGPLTYPKNQGLRDALREVGKSNFVLETDCPYLPVQKERGRRNEPKAVSIIAATAAATLGIDEKEIADVTTRNARDLYRLG